VRCSFLFSFLVTFSPHFYSRFFLIFIFETSILLSFSLQISFMSLFEFYRMGVPLFAPSPELLTKWHQKSVLDIVSSIFYDHFHQQYMCLFFTIFILRFHKNFSSRSSLFVRDIRKPNCHPSDCCKNIIFSTPLNV
jgi:hypothetical protein